MNDLEIAGNTGMLPYRVVNGQKVFVFADIAGALGVGQDAIRRQFSRNAGGWESGETGLGHFASPSGIQETRWFNARGAMRFCRHTKSGNSDALFNHLLDLWERERATPAVPRMSEVDKLALLLGHELPGIHGRLAAQDDRLLAIEAKQQAIEPERIADQIGGAVAVAKIQIKEELEAEERTVRFLRIHIADLTDRTVALLSDPYKSMGEAVWKAQRSKEYRRLNGIIKDMFGGRQYIRRVDQANRAIEAIHDRMRILGVTPPPAPTVGEIRVPQRLTTLDGGRDA